MRHTTILLLTAMAALMLASGMALAVTRQCKDGVPCYGTREPDKLIGTEAQNFMYGKGDNDRLLGKGDSDYLYGTGGADRLFGGPSAGGADYLYGGPGGDLLNGGEDRDVYTFEGNSWGKDRIDDPDTSDTAQFVDLSAALTVTLIPSSTAPEVTNAARTSTVNWSNPINEVNNQSTGDDTITGNLLNNRITSEKGFDDVRGDMGNDFIDVADGSGADVVDCGENPGDNDAVNYDGRTETSLGDTATNCEVLDPD
jgi:Ca2+-binding RTX toxin-like protein